MDAATNSGPSSHREADADVEQEFKDATSEDTCAVGRVALRLPQFWAEDPEIWFAQVEAQFACTSTKNDSTKFFQVIRELDQRTASEVRDVITNPPATGKYEKLKHELINRLSVSHEHRMRQLLTHEELGDRKPSQFLRHLRALAGDGVNDDFLRSLWSGRLPTHIQVMVAILADQIYDVVPTPVNQVASTSASSIEGMFQRLEQTISSRIQDELNRQISQLNIGQNRGRNTYRGQNNNTRSRSNSRNNRSDGYETRVCVGIIISSPIKLPNVYRRAILRRKTVETVSRGGSRLSYNYPSPFYYR
ncbi:uncharacterized protein LOC114360711 [Ostrinia furnacalis]|uniref:uncharacterized protein LOC114360711 n=1 Tax=Ostrinia furnacalis TaxID=93504 RepID=UPI0010397291|nr:uncharacterized protein LOC114360711 [Ostrinia furnacalis]